EGEPQGPVHAPRRLVEALRRRVRRLLLLERESRSRVAHVGEKETRLLLDRIEPVPALPVDRIARGVRERGRLDARYPRLPVLDEDGRSRGERRLPPAGHGEGGALLAGIVESHDTVGGVPAGSVRVLEPREVADGQRRERRRVTRTQRTGRESVLRERDLPDDLPREVEEGDPLRVGDDGVAVPES